MTELSTKQTNITELRCQNCGGIIIGKRIDSKFCTAKCKQQDYKKRTEKNGPKHLALLFVKSFTNFDKEAGEQQRNRILDIIEKNNNAGATNFKKHITGFDQLNSLLTVIERFYRYYQNGSVKKDDLKKVAEELSKIKSTLWQKAHHELKIHTVEMKFFIEFVKNKISELQMLGEKEDKTDLPTDFKEKLISFHAKISEKLELKAIGA